MEQFYLAPLRNFLVLALFVPASFGVFHVEGSPLLAVETASPVALRLPSIETVQPALATAPVPKSKPVAQRAIAAEIRSTIPLHAYPAYGLESTTLVGETHVTAVYFVPKDQIEGRYSDWNENITITLEAIKGYMAREFDGRLNVSYTVHPAVLVGDHELARYGELDGNKVSLRQEVIEKIGWRDINDRERAAGRYPVLLIYFHSGYQGRFQATDARLGGAIALLQTAMIPAFQLEREMISGPRQTGLITSAHEFAHLLGIPHPWEQDPAIEDQPGNLMGYQSMGQLMETRIDDRVKQAMGL